MRSATQFREGDPVTLYMPGSNLHGKNAVVICAHPGRQVLVRLAEQIAGSRAYFFYPSELWLDPITRIGRLA